MLPQIPSYQTLGRKTGWRCWPSRRPYPLGYQKTRLYYLGRNAVYHGARALGLGAGDEILFPAYHSGTESAPLMHMGCNLRFYGVERDLSIDLQEIEAKIGPQTKAIYAIHFFGFQAPIEELRELADRHGLVLIEDVALSFLSQLHGRPLGTWGDVSIFCLYKSLPTAAGGILAVNRPDIVLPPEPRRGGFYSELNLTMKHVVRSWELHGGPIGRWARRCVEKCVKPVVTGAKLQSPDSLDFEPELLNRGMGLITRGLLHCFDYTSAARRRRKNYVWMANRLRDTGVAMLREELPDGAVPLFFPILVDRKFPAVETLHQQRIEAIPVWGIHHPYLRRGEFPGTEFLVEHAVEIPIFQDLSERHLERIAGALIQHCRASDKLLEARNERHSSEQLAATV